MARTGALIAAGPAFLWLLSLVLPRASSFDEGLLAATAVAGLALGGALIGLYDRVPRWAFHAAAVLLVLLASLAAYAWGAPEAYAPLPYALVTLFVFFHFPPRTALAYLALIAVAYGVVLAAESLDYTPLAGWFATVGSLGVMALLVALAREAMSARIERLAEAAHRDALTQLLNRRGFEEAFELELERARRGDSTLSLVVGDLDRFKRMNDERGHAAGDEALRRVARTIDSVKRGFDSAARVGGEEFALLAPGADEHGAYMLAERIREDVERSFGDGTPSLTASFGVATFPLHGQSPEGLLRSADQALYAAKRLGRNRTVISSAEVPGILAGTQRAQGEAPVELASLISLAEALDVRELGSPSHSRRVARFAELTARELGLRSDTVERVRLAGILHDVGRVGVPDGLLTKSGPLTEEEWDWVRSHPATGARMLATTEFDDIGSWILLHHERPDGKGYPERRAWDDVPLAARILAVADAYEAMTADRPYRAALSAEEAARELRRGAGRQFDGEVVEALLRVL
jgi:diguanylate cyclase (GGDEF)-like protein